MTLGQVSLLEAINALQDAVTSGVLTLTVDGIDLIIDVSSFQTQAMGVDASDESGEKCEYVS